MDKDVLVGRTDVVGNAVATEGLDDGVREGENVVVAKSLCAFRAINHCGDVLAPLPPGCRSFDCNDSSATEQVTLASAAMETKALRNAIFIVATASPKRNVVYLRRIDFFV